MIISGLSSIAQFFSIMYQALSSACKRVMDVALSIFKAKAPEPVSTLLERRNVTAHNLNGSAHATAGEAGAVVVDPRIPSLAAAAGLTEAQAAPIDDLAALDGSSSSASAEEVVVVSAQDAALSTATAGGLAAGGKASRADFFEPLFRGASPRLRGGLGGGSGGEGMRPGVLTVIRQKPSVPGGPGAQQGLSLKEYPLLGSDSESKGSGLSRTLRSWNWAEHEVTGVGVNRSRSGRGRGVNRSRSGRGR